MKKHILILTIFLAVIACKEDEVSAPEPTPSEMIARTWKVQSVLIDGQADNTTEYSSFRFIFNPDQTYRFIMPNERQGNWELVSNATSLTLDKGTDQEQRINVFKLSETALDLEFTQQDEKMGTSRILFELVP